MQIQRRRLSLWRHQNSIGYVLQLKRILGRLKFITEFPEHEIKTLTHTAVNNVIFYINYQNYVQCASYFGVLIKS